MCLGAHKTVVRTCVYKGKLRNTRICSSQNHMNNHEYYQNVQQHQNIMWQLESSSLPRDSHGHVFSYRYSRHQLLGFHNFQWHWRHRIVDAFFFQALRRLREEISGAVTAAFGLGNAVVFTNRWFIWVPNYHHYPQVTFPNYHHYPQVTYRIMQTIAKTSGWIVIFTYKESCCEFLVLNHLLDWC